jgi:hypothetical protein
MECKYLYIDDAPTAQANGTISGLAEAGKLQITHDHPTGSWDEQIQYIIDKVKNFHGLILDLRLDQGTSKNGSQSNYRGTSLAQELRILSREKKVDDLPIILLSAEENLINYFDSTGDDLFDLIISKEKISAHFQVTKEQLCALAIGYPLLRTIAKENTTKSLESILSLPENDFTNLDPRFLTKLVELMVTAHGFSNFFINQVLKRNGIFIDELTLAARLGIDITNSSDWPDFKSYLYGKIGYHGLYADGWNRFWSYQFDNWITETINPPEDFRSIKAIDRIKLITEKTDFKKLTAAVPYKLANSDKFWDICQGSGNALDVTEGLLVTNQDALFPWQDRKYVSIQSALYRENSHKWNDVAALEKPKLDKLKAIFGRERVRRQ